LGFGVVTAREAILELVDRSVRGRVMAELSVTGVSFDCEIAMAAQEELRRFVQTAEPEDDSDLLES
jgi:hypothetical protein